MFGEKPHNELNTGHLAVGTDAVKLPRMLERRSVIDDSFHCGRGIMVGNMSTETSESRTREMLYCDGRFTHESIADFSDVDAFGRAAENR